MNKPTYMIKFQRSRPIFFVLITAMLSMQWSITHIHLAEHHDHNESHHQHTVDAHAHQSFTQNDYFIDSIQQIHDHETSIVVFNNDCNIHKWNHLDDQPLAFLVTFQSGFIFQSGSVEKTVFNNSKQPYNDYSTIRLRAPPKFS